MASLARGFTTVLGQLRGLAAERRELGPAQVRDLSRLGHGWLFALYLTIRLGNHLVKCKPTR